MATSVINSSELADFETVPHPHRLTSPAASAPNNTFAQFRHPKAGLFTLKGISFPYMHVTDAYWDTTEDIQIINTTPTDNIHIDFQLNGYLHSQFRGLRHDLDMRPKKHNLIYTPEPGYYNRLKGNQSITMLLISLDRQFFASVVGPNDAWSERILTDLHQQRPFSAIPGTQIITPAMLYLIEGIRNCPARGPMRNLLIQSRVLELLALEIEQFSSSAITDETIRLDDAEKLYQLKAYLDAHFLSDLSLAQLSRVCLLNEFKVKQGFKRLFDTTVFNYVRKLRMEYAGRLLRNCPVSVDEVADTLGYEHAQHFSIAFKKYTGLTPSQYQRGKAGGSSMSLKQSV